MLFCASLFSLAIFKTLYPGLGNYIEENADDLFFSATNSSFLEGLCCSNFYFIFSPEFILFLKLNI